MSVPLEDQVSPQRLGMESRSLAIRVTVTVGRLLDLGGVGGEGTQCVSQGTGSLEMVVIMQQKLILHPFCSF